VGAAGLERRAEIDERKYLRDEVAAYHAATLYAAQREEQLREGNSRAARKAAIKKWNDTAAARRQDVAARPAPIPHPLDAFQGPMSSLLQAAPPSEDVSSVLDDPVFLDVDRKATGDADTVLYETVNGKLLEGLSSLKRLQNLLQRRASDIVALQELLLTLQVDCESCCCS
jgi:hypothetical protein